VHCHFDLPGLLDRLVRRDLLLDELGRRRDGDRCRGDGHGSGSSRALALTTTEQTTTVGLRRDQESGADGQPNEPIHAFSLYHRVSIFRATGNRPSKGGVRGGCSRVSRTATSASRGAVILRKLEPCAGWG